jgi:Membrane protein involved in the export of O-antigen and teichoic acid
MSKIEQFAKNSVLYFVGQMATRVISFVLLPLYSNRFAKEEYGYFDWANSILLVAVSVICIELWACILRFMYDDEDTQEKYKVITNGFFMIAGSMAIYSVAFLVLSNLVTVQYAPYIYIYGIITILQYVYGFVARGLHKNVAYMLSGTIASTLILVTNIVLIVGFNMSVVTLFISGIIGGVAQIIILEVVVRNFKHMKWKYLDADLMKRMLRFSLPLCVNTIAFWMLNSYGRIPILRELGMGANGVFAMASRFTMILSMVVSVFTLAWQELAFSLGNSEDRSVYYSKGLSLYVKFLGCGILMLLPATQLAFAFINENYSEALVIIPVFYVGTMASSISAFLGNIFGAEKKTKTIMISTGVAALVNVIVIELTIGQIGLLSVTIALFLGFLADICIRLVMLKRITALKVELKFLWVLILLYMAVTYVFYKGTYVVNVIAFVGTLIFSVWTFRDIVKLFLGKIKEILSKSKK